MADIICSRILDLLVKVIDGELSLLEEFELLRWVDESPVNRFIYFANIAFRGKPDPLYLEARDWLINPPLDKRTKEARTERLLESFN